VIEWIGVVGTIGAALVGGVFVVIAAALRRENTEQHAANQAKLEAIGEDVSEVKMDVRDVRKSQSRHLEWHAEQGR